MILYHGSTNPELCRAAVTATRTGGKHVKPGRVCAGFYATPSREEAQQYADMTTGPSFVYILALSTRANVQPYDGDITRISESTAANLRAQGVDAITGQDIRGRFEVCILEPRAITHMSISQ